MKKLLIILLVFILFISNINLVTSKPILSNNIIAKLEYLNENEINNNINEVEIINNYNKLNGFFTENNGQVNNELVKYYIQGKGIWFLNNSVIFEIMNPLNKPVLNKEPVDKYHGEIMNEDRQSISRKSAVLKLIFKGANEIVPTGGGLLSHRSNFFYGNESNKWNTNVPNYQEIIYVNIYDDIDLKYYFSARGLKYDFIVRPGGNPKDIKMSYNGAEQINIDSSGNIKIETIVGNIFDSDLFIYQYIDNELAKISGKFELLNSQTYGFNIVNKYDLSKDLIIDPLVYSTYVGGSLSDAGWDITVDSNGKAYVIGQTISTDFPTTIGAYNTTYNGGFLFGDIFVLKLNSNGSSLLYSTYIGGSDEDFATGIKIDANGNIYGTGHTYSTDFPTTPNAYDTAHNGPSSNDVYIFNLNSMGSSLLYSTYIGGMGDEIGADLAIDKNNNVYSTGTTESSNFPTTPSAYSTTYKWGREAFVLKLNPAGNGANDLIYSTFISSSNHDDALGITIDSNNEVYVTGVTGIASDFPITSGAYDVTHNGNYDCFVIKLNSIGSTLIYSTLIGGIGYEDGRDIEIDNKGNIFVSGSTTNSSNFPITQGAYDSTDNGNYDCFAIKLNPAGNGVSDLLYSTYIGGSGVDVGEGIEINSGNNVFVTGYTDSSDFPTTSNAYDNTFNGATGYDAFILKINQNGTSLMYSSFFGGNDSELSYSIDIDNSSNIYIAGFTYSTDFPTTPGAYNTVHNTSFWCHAFVLKLGLNSTPSALNLQISKQSILRTKPVYLYSNATDPDDAEEDLTPIFEYRDSNEQIWNDTNFMDTIYNNSRWEISFIPPKNAPLGEYDFRVGYYDSGMSFSNWYYLYNSLSVLNNFPDVIDFSLTNNSSIQNESISIFINTSDIEDEEQNLTIELKYKDPTDQNWNTTYLGTAEYSDDRWGMDFCAPFGSLFGNYDFKVRALDKDGNNSNWFYKNDSLLIYNLNPEVLNIEISKNVIYRTESISLLVNGSDYETSEQFLEFYIQYKLNKEENWKNLQENYLNEHWRSTYITKINTTLGYYDFRAKFKDLNNGISDWLYLNNSLFVLNNLPIAENIELSKNIAILGNEILIQINGNDIEEPEENLTTILEYRDPTEQSWDTLYLNSPKFLNDRWEHSFLIPFEAPFGYYDFRTKFIDSDGNHSAWLYANDSLLVSNMNPKVIDLKLSESVVYRTNSIFLSINGTDHETPESMLIFYAQFKHDTETVWTEITGDYSILNNNWEVEFVTGIDSILGYYDFRVKFEDNESASSGWVYFNDSLEVLNNLPIILEGLDEINVGIQPLILDLTMYESDIEDTNENLTWGIEPQIYTFIETIGIIDAVNDSLNITPKENVKGTEDIELILIDKDSGTAIKSDITIIVDSTISDLTPKVTLLTPPDKTKVDTLTPILKWSLDYSGTEIITYPVALDENPDPLTIIKTGLTTTEYTLENELMDGKTYYWKVEPTNGICLSGSFSFTVDLGFEPIYQVNLTSEKSSVTIKQSESKSIELTLTNEGNSIDNFNIQISAGNLQSQTSIDKNNVQLGSNIETLLKLNINIPYEFTTGDYFITVTATSLTDITASDDVKIDVKVLSKDFVPEFDVRISISPSSLDLIQGDSENVTITITNDGNIEDDFNIRFESDDLTSADIKLSKDFLFLNKDDFDQIIGTINIPENLEPGEYTIKFIVESDDTSNESILTIYVKEKVNQGSLVDGAKTSNSNLDNVYLLFFLIILGLIVISTIFIGGTEIGKYRFLLIFFVPLYNKLHPDDVLDNFTRGKIYGYIFAKPGENYNAIKNALDLHDGTFSYHLRILEKEKYIFSQRDGFNTRFYPKGVKAPTSIGIQFNEFQKQIIEKIREQPGIAQHEIVTMLGLSQQVVSYNLTKLTRGNILTIKKEGRENKYYINYIEQTTTKIQVDNQTQPMPVQQ